MGKAEIRNFSTSLQLDISQVSAVIFHILQAMKRRKIVKLGLCMTAFLNFDPYTTLDLFHPKQ